MSLLPAQSIAPKGLRNWTRLRAEFRAADWDFAADAAGAGGELHPYPARFIPALPARALDLIRPDGVVLDPFCGSGTTLQEAQRRGLEAVGNDLNPIACLISRVRCSPWTHGDAAVAAHHASKLAASALQAAHERRPAPPIPRIDHWFAEWAQSLLAGAVNYLAGVSREDPWHDRLALAISACVVRLSRQDSDTRYAAVEKRGDAEDGARTLSRSILRTADWLKGRTWSSRSPVTVLEGDAQHLPALADRSVSAAIFSPPYPNAYEYWLYHKYRMYWLGYDPIAVRVGEYGARPHYCRPNGLTAEDFAKQMTGVFAELARVLAPGAPAVVVIGDSRIARRWIDNGHLLIEAASLRGFDLVAHCQRRILRQRSSFNSAHGAGRRGEHMLLLRAPS